jgi:aspartate/methionine/tyrosine aminotransferase
MIVPFPIQAAMIAGLHDTDHVRAQKEIYRRRRELLRSGLEGFGFRIDHSTAGLYLWSTAGKNCWDSLADLAELGIIAGPGEFYGEAADDHVRVALTASDERIEAASDRLRTAAG